MFSELTYFKNINEAREFRIDEKQKVNAESKKVNAAEEWDALTTLENNELSSRD